MPDNQKMSPAEQDFAIWREDPAIRFLIDQLAKNTQHDALDALLQSAFEAGHMAGRQRALG